jgi:hypothetical protein
MEPLCKWALLTSAVIMHLLAMYLSQLQVTPEQATAYRERAQQICGRLAEVRPQLPLRSLTAHGWQIDPLRSNYYKYVQGVSTQ